MRRMIQSFKDTGTEDTFDVFSIQNCQEMFSTVKELKIPPENRLE
jgi:hypothetical protein